MKPCALLYAAILWLGLSGLLPALELPAPEIATGENVVSWQGRGTLLDAPSPAGPWSVVPDAVSPYGFNPADQDRRFFRIGYDLFNYVVVDTNQTDSYDVAGNVLDPPPAEGEIYFGQDALYPESPPEYTDNGDGTVTDNQTGLTWQQVPPAAFYSWTEAQAYAASLVLAGRTDWRLPTVKELLSLADFNGSSRPEIDRPYIDDSIFTIHDPLAISTFVPASAVSTKRDIDGQFWSSDAYVGRTINNDSSTFGFNFIDGRIKAYPNGVLSGPTGTAFVRCVRGNPDYGKNNFIDNGDGTIIDLATGLMWLQNDSGHWPSVGSRGDGTLDWVEALDWAENLAFAGHDDWTLPDAKQLQSIVDYTRAPDADDPAKQSAAIDPIFHTSTDESWCWTSTSLGDDLFAWGMYVCFGRALAIDPSTLQPTVNAHGAGAMRSDPKTGDPSIYASGHGPQNDQVRIYNHVRPVRRCSDPPSPQTADTDAITITLSGETSAPADIQISPLSVTFNGVAIDPAVVSRPSAQEILFDFDTSALAPGDYQVTATYEAPHGVQTGTYTVQANILLLIIDDWGHDASPIDNTEPDAVLANMPVVETLAAQGLRFTRAYAQPTCSPTRASILCGRQVWQTGVGDPTEANSFSTAEITLPDAFSAMNAPHHLLTVGKWHLGGNDTGYATRGGWPEFHGITGGGVTDYFSWQKNSNGTVATSTTYSTTDQVNEASAFIEAREGANEPWFTWVAFNAPHTPFHEPPASLAPPGGYSAAAPGESTDSHHYRMMLEALDTEIGRLLEAVNPVRTHIILVGDNGTPGSVVQAPYSSAHAKDSLYNGGTHVPMVIAGPGVTVPHGSTSDAPVHVIDLFSTILEMAGIDESAVPGLSARNPLSTSIVPILSGTDTGSRAMVAESGGGDPGRAILLGNHTDYKLIIHGDPDDTTDTPVFEFYNIGAPGFDRNEESPLDPATLTGDALAAYDACVAMDAALGGGYSDPPSGFDTLYIELPTSGVTPPVPDLLRPDGITPIEVSSVSVDGVTANVIGRFDSGASLVDESDDQPAQYWVKVRVSPANGGPYTSAHVFFPTAPNGNTREYDSTSLLVNPNP